MSQGAQRAGETVSNENTDLPPRELLSSQKPGTQTAHGIGFVIGGSTKIQEVTSTLPSSFQFG